MQQLGPNKRKQYFVNKGSRPKYIVLELSTSRFRLDPGQELVLVYSVDDVGNGPSTPLQIEMTDGNELIVYTGEHEMFSSDGKPAPLNFEIG